MSIEAHPMIDLPFTIKTLDELKAFDAVVCKSGTKVFFRRIHPAETVGAPEPMDGMRFTLVEEIKPGARLKRFFPDVSIIGNG